MADEGHVHRQSDNDYINLYSQNTGELQINQEDEANELDYQETYTEEMNEDRDEQDDNHHIEKDMKHN